MGAGEVTGGDGSEVKIGSDKVQGILKSNGMVVANSSDHSLIGLFWNPNANILMAQRFGVDKTDPIFADVARNGEERFAIGEEIHVQRLYFEGQRSGNSTRSPAVERNVIGVLVGDGSKVRWETVCSVLFTGVTGHTSSTEEEGKELGGPTKAYVTNGLRARKICLKRFQLPKRVISSVWIPSHFVAPPTRNARYLAPQFDSL